MAPPDALGSARVSFDAPAPDVKSTDGGSENLLRDAALTTECTTSPTTGMPLVALDGPAAWKPEDLRASQNWGRTLTEAQISELHAVLAHAKANGLEWEEVDGMNIPANMTKELFALGPELRSLVATMAAELEDGTGAVMIENFPVHGIPHEDVGALYVGLCSHIGALRWAIQRGAQVPQPRLRRPSRPRQGGDEGQHPGGWQAVQQLLPAAHRQVRRHLLLGIARRGQGCASRVCSCATAFNEMLKKYPRLVPKLFNPVERIWEGEDGKVALPLMDITKEGKFTSQISPSTSTARSRCRTPARSTTRPSKPSTWSKRSGWRTASNSSCSPASRTGSTTTRCTMDAPDGRTPPKRTSPPSTRQTPSPRRPMKMKTARRRPAGCCSASGCRRTTPARSRTIRDTAACGRRRTRRRPRRTRTRARDRRIVPRGSPPGHGVREAQLLRSVQASLRMNRREEYAPISSRRV